MAGIDPWPTARTTSPSRLNPIPKNTRSQMAPRYKDLSLEAIRSPHSQMQTSRAEPRYLIPHKWQSLKGYEQGGDFRLAESYGLGLRLGRGTRLPVARLVDAARLLRQRIARHSVGAGSRS